MEGRRRSISLLVAALVSLPARSISTSASVFRVQLLEHLQTGSTSLLLSDCAHAFVGQRLVLGQGGNREEAEISSVRCPASGEPVGLQAATSLAALGESSRKLRPGQQQALMPNLEVQALRRVSGLVTLRFATINAHDVGDIVYGFGEAHDKIVLVSQSCAGQPSCSGHGVCNTSSGSCDCDAGWGGSACTVKLCPGGCGTGTCSNGTCTCPSGYTGQNCEVASCEAGCNGHGECVAGTCACHHNFHGPTCLLQTASCPDDCNGNGHCTNGSCICHSQYAGISCLQLVSLSSCPHGCSGNGRCSVKSQCICAMGYSAQDCSVACPNRCSGHGECFDGACTCYEGYEGVDCSTPQPQSFSNYLLGGVFAYYPVFILFFYCAIFLVGFCVIGYLVNRYHGRFGTSAIPMWDYYAKTWRNAPLFEPVVLSTRRP